MCWFFLRDGQPSGVPTCSFRITARLTTTSADWSREAAMSTALHGSARKVCLVKKRGRCCLGACLSGGDVPSDDD